MPLQTTIQIVLRVTSLAPNLSVTESLCREHIFREDTDWKALLREMDAQLQQKGDYSAALLDLLNVFLFNVCALNQQLICDMDNQYLESTEDHHNQRGSKRKSTLSPGASIKLKLQSWLEGIINLPFFERMFAEITVAHLNKDRSIKQLLQTIDYLISKYQLTSKHKARIVELIEQSSQGSMLQQMQSVILNLNRKIFSSGQELSTFLDSLSDNYLVNLHEMARLIVSNYVETHPPRSLFQSTTITGSSLAEEVIDYVIRKVPKGDLFAQKIENYRPYELFMHVIFQKQAAALIEWNQLVLELISHSRSSIFKNESIFQHFGTFMTFYLPSEYPHLHFLLKYTYSSLLAKYSSQDSFELIKKFILNRLFLNPAHFSLLMAPEQDQMLSYVQCANSIRTLFYQKKVAVLQVQHENLRISEISSLLINSLKTMLSAKQQMKGGIETRDRGLYVNDKLLLKSYGQLSEALTGHRIGSSHKSQPSFQSQVSLLFSLKNQSRKVPQSPQIHQNSSSIPSLPRPQNRQLTPKQEDSQLSHRLQLNHQHINQGESDMEQLNKLILLRKQYGQLHRERRLRCSEHSSRRESVMREMMLLNEGARQLRVELQRPGQSWMLQNLLF